MDARDHFNGRYDQQAAPLTKIKLLYVTPEKVYGRRFSK